MDFRCMDANTGELLYTVIHLNEAWTECHRCGKDTPVRWSLPVRADTAEYARNDYAGEWGGVASCKDCFEWHERWSAEREN